MTKAVIIILFFFLSSLNLFSQKQPASGKKPSARKAAASKPSPTPKKEISEKEEFDKAVAVTDTAERISALKGFSVKFPESPNRVPALEMLAASRASYAEEKMQAGETDTALIVFKQTVDELPAPVPPKLFTETVYKIPATLYWRGQRTAAVEAAKIIEAKVGDNAAQLVDLATFYLGIEGGGEAKRLAEKAVQLDPASATAYQALGLANRLNFDLEASAAAYAKALELDPASAAARRSLAEMKRALGNSAEAVSLYREILSKDENDRAARNGLTLSLFEAGKISEAEAELASSLEQNSKDVVLLAGAAYWYAANNQPDKAVDLAQKAVAAEPRYIWSHIALARGLIGQKKPLEAERILLGSRQYGNFPTLEYEIASARLMAGFYREAAEELKKSFSISDGVIKTKLGGRVQTEGKDFVELLAAERRASIFAPGSAASPEHASRLKLLLQLTETINSPGSGETDIVRAADEFVAGDDGMKLHRQLYAADALVKKKLALPKVLELMHSAIGKADASLDVLAPAAAVMASELYESRSLAIARGEVIRVPDVPRQMLSAIVRGRIEEIAGWALYHQGSQAEAIVRLRRAVSVLPEKSAWWRSSVWKLGAALEADGKDTEALDLYIKSYVTDKPDLAKYISVERLYQRVHGNTEGLEAKIGPNPLPVAAKDPTETIEPVALKTEPTPETVATPPASEAAPQSIPSPTPEGGLPKSIPAKDPINETAAPPESEPEKATPAETESKEPPRVDPSPSPTVDQAPVAEASPSPPPEETEKVVDTSKQTSELPPIIVGAKPAEPEKTPEAIEPAETQQATATPAPTPETPPESVPTPSPTPETVPEAVATPTPTPAETQSSDPLTAAPESKIADEELPDPPPAKPDTSLVTQAEASETKLETTDAVATGQKPPAEAKPSGAKPLFDPVIITIPRGGVLTKTPVVKKPPETEVAKNDPVAETAAAETAPVEKNEDDTGDAGNTTRERVVEESSPPVVSKCEITASQDSISLLNNGGNLGLLIGIDRGGDIKTVKAVSSSPQDVDLTLEPEIAGFADKAFYVIKSISTNTGTFKVAFEAPCGRKEVSVTVR